jgi:hypothetical protein
LLFLPSRLLSKIWIKIQRTTTLPVVLHVCLTSSLILRKEHRTRVFKNKELRTTFSMYRRGKTICWTKLHYEELHENIMRVI